MKKLFGILWPCCGGLIRPGFRRQGGGQWRGRWGWRPGRRRRSRAGRGRAGGPTRPMASITSSQGIGAVDGRPEPYWRRLYGVHGAHDIPLDAGDFHQARHRVTDKPQQIAKSHGCGCGAGGSGAAFQIAEGGGRHGAGGAHFGLTASLRAGQAGWHGPRSPARSLRPHTTHRRSLRRWPDPPGQGQQHRSRTPQLPAVGAATIRFMQALHSAVLRASAVTADRYAPPSSRPWAAACSTLAASPPTRPLAAAAAGVVVPTGLLHHLPQTAHLGPAGPPRSDGFWPGRLRSTAWARVPAVLMGVRSASRHRIKRTWGFPLFLFIRRHPHSGR